VRIASFNVENLFDRAKAFSLQDEAAARVVLEQYARINELFDAPAYTQADKAEMVELLARLGLAQRDDGGRLRPLALEPRPAAAASAPGKHRDHCQRPGRLDRLG
jgi:hypothetical protein